MPDEVIRLAVSVIGITQCIKNIIDDGNILTEGTKKLPGFVLTLMTVAVTAIVVTVDAVSPVVSNGLFVLSTATLSYDTIYKCFDKFIKSKLGSKDE